MKFICAHQKISEEIFVRDKSMSKIILSNRQCGELIFYSTHTATGRILLATTA